MNDSSSDATSRRPNIPLGVFTLERVIGTGGMGVVWAGRHTEQGAEVAVKVLRSDQAARVKVRKSFFREAQSVGRMYHPGIIRIIDYGEVDEAAHEHSDGEMELGCPYIAMELAKRGSLGNLVGRLSWRQLRWMLIEVLNALAHAHARDLIHRDLKPDNILMTSNREGTTKLKLTDFGVVHISDSEVEGSTQNLLALVAGTPSYMAPEQLRGRWRQFGPWTDLYSLGCIAYEQCCGHLPFKGDTLYELAYQQMSKEPPPLEPRMVIPKGFEEWVMRLLSKNPHERFRRAADAAWALTQLGDPIARPNDDTDIIAAADISPSMVGPRRDTLSDVTWVLESDPTHTTENTLHTHLTTITTQLELSREIRNLEAKREASPDPPPLPKTWQRTTTSAASLSLIGAGLGLFGLREIPFVGRLDARDALWTQLHAAHSERRPHAIVVRGGSGVGKSRLSSWLVERAHEVGGASVLRAAYQAEAGERGGLIRMVMRYFSATGLTRAKAYEQVMTRLKTFARPGDDIQRDALAIVELMLPGDPEAIPGGDEQERISVRTPAERFGVLSILLRYISRDRPIIVWMDDAHRSAKALSVTRMLLDDMRTAQLPVLVLLGLNDDAHWDQQPEDLEAINANERAESVSLEPLDLEERARFRDLLLPLEPGLAEQLDQLTQGNPMFTVQLVGEWVERGSLEVGQGGWRLKPGVELFSPASIDQLWGQRLEHLSWSMREELSPLQIHTALELAAVLGLEVDMELWREGCQDMSFELPDQLPREMATRGVVHLDGERAQFVHDVVRRFLITRAEEAGRLTMHHECAAHVLQRRLVSGNEDTDVLSRVVEHLVRASAIGQAIEPLTKLAQLSQRRGEFGLAAGHLEALQELLYEHELNERDPRWIVLDGLRAISQWASHGVTAALKIVNHTIARAMATQDKELLARLHLTRARLLWEAGRKKECAASCHTSSDAFAEVGDSLGVARCFALYARLHLSQRQLKQAAEYARTGIELCQSLEDELPIHDIYGARAHLDFAAAQIHVERERFDQATVVLKRAQWMFREVGDRLNAELVRYEFGRLAHQQGNAEAAERFYLDAIGELDDISHGMNALPRLHYGIMLLELGDVIPAREKLTAAIERLRAHGYTSALTLGYLATAAVWAATQDVVQWERDFETALQYIEQSAVPSVELAVCAELGADALARWGHWAAAARALESAADFWHFGGAHSRATEARERAARCLDEV